MEEYTWYESPRWEAKGDAEGPDGTAVAGLYKSMGLGIGVGMR